MSKYQVKVAILMIRNRNLRSKCFSDYINSRTDENKLKIVANSVNHIIRNQG